jgi:selenocysteine lyase/cysteine desulfurase
MSISRREFVVSAASLAATAVATHADQTAPRQAAASSDPLGVRADFPITQTRTYLNSAYITPVPSQVVAAGRAFVESKSIKPISLGEMLRKTDQVRTQFAQLIHAEADEIGFLFATSEGENVVANALDLKAGDNVVVDDLHYETEFVLYQHLRESKGIEFRVVKHRDGRVDGKDFEALVDRRTRLVSVAWVSHHNGFRHDMRPIADLAHSVGAIFYVDGIQALGMIATDVRAAGVDVMCAGTYKWMLGGFGVAPFYVRRDLLDRIRLDRFGALHVERTLADGGFQLYRTAKRFDYATLPFCEVYQLGAGLDYVARVGVERIEQHTVTLAQSLRAGLAAQGYKLFTPEGNRSSIVTYLTAKEAGTLTAAFDRAAIDVTVRAATGQVRVSPALFNTHDDIAKFLEVTKSLA